MEQKKRPRLGWESSDLPRKRKRTDGRTISSRQACCLLRVTFSEELLIEARDNTTWGGGEKNNERKQACVSTGVEGRKEERKQHQQEMNAWEFGQFEPRKNGKIVITARQLPAPSASSLPSHPPPTRFYLSYRHPPRFR